MLLDELKSKAYDIIVLLEQGRMQLQNINDQILKEQQRIREEEQAQVEKTVKE